MKYRVIVVNELTKLISKVMETDLDKNHVVDKLRESTRNDAWSLELERVGLAPAPGDVAIIPGKLVRRSLIFIQEVE